MVKAIFIFFHERTAVEGSQDKIVRIWQNKERFNLDNDVKDLKTNSFCKNAKLQNFQSKFVEQHNISKR